jgi:hypothetical protein
VTRAKYGVERGRIQRWARESTDKLILGITVLRTGERLILMIGRNYLLVDGVTGFCLGKFLAITFFRVLLASYGRDLRILAVNNACCWSNSRLDGVQLRL